MKLAIKPSRGSRQRLREERTANVSAEVTYPPTRGDPNTQSKKLKLVQRG